MKILNDLSALIMKSSVLTGLAMGLMGGAILVAPFLVPAGLKALYGFLKARSIAAGKHVASNKGVYFGRLKLATFALFVPFLFVFYAIREHASELPEVYREIGGAWKTGKFA